MRVKAACASMAMFLCLAATAQAFVWHLGAGQAKHATKEFAAATCKSERRCVAYGPCKRASESRVDCAAAFLYKGVSEPGDEVACAILLHWGVNHNGEIALKRHGRPTCRAVETEPEKEFGDAFSASPART
ncbi:MAG TPA: hypothetical protein VFN89_02350 [Solirubrobacterales bacterium]|nr:hypothetical protein [Solirubrobacterales bacterium]